MSTGARCPCGTGLAYSDCCQPCHGGARRPATAEQLMRARYSAYVRNEIPFLLDTWCVTTRPAGLDASVDPSVRWLGLSILRTEAGLADDQAGRVEFIARYRAGGQSRRLHELSRFVRQDGCWCYLDGEVFPDGPPEGVRVGRNAPCPCGSGKKYKACCLR